MIHSLLGFAKSSPYGCRCILLLRARCPEPPTVKQRIQIMTSSVFVLYIFSCVLIINGRAWIRTWNSIWAGQVLLKCSQKVNPSEKFLQSFEVIICVTRFQKLGGWSPPPPRFRRLCTRHCVFNGIETDNWTHLVNHRPTFYSSSPWVKKWNPIANDWSIIHFKLRYIRIEVNIENWVFRTIDRVPDLETLVLDNIWNSLLQFRDVSEDWFSGSCPKLNFSHAIERITANG